jgi:hypothetical protein
LNHKPAPPDVSLWSEDDRTTNYAIERGKKSKNGTKRVASMIKSMNLGGDGKKHGLKMRLRRRCNGRKMG